MCTLINSDQLCSYGCGKPALYINKSHKLMCNTSPNKCTINKNKNAKGLSEAYKTGLRDAKKNYQTLSENKKQNMQWNKGVINADFSYEGKGNHKGVLINERGHKCECCTNTEWQNKSIILELEHVDADRNNNTRENLKLLCPNCHSQTPTWKRGINNQKKIIIKIIEKESVKSSWNKGKFNADFSYEGKGNHKSILIQERGHKCECCKNTEWFILPITLELEHIDGDNKNNIKNNLKLLCPNCHSQTSTWRGKKATGKRKHTDEVIINAIKSSENMNQTLIKLNYRYGSKKTVLKIKEKYNLEFLTKS